MRGGEFDDCLDRGLLRGDKQPKVGLSAERLYVSEGLATLGYDCVRGDPLVSVRWWRVMG